MKISQVRSYQTSDGQLHSDHGDALTHETKIEVRGMIQTIARANLDRSGVMTPSQVADFIVSHAEDVYKTISSYRTKKNRARRDKK